MEEIDRGAAANKAFDDGSAWEGVTATMRMFDDLLGVVLQLPTVDDELLAAFRAGPTVCSYLESTGSVPVPLWAFAFPEPLGALEVCFDGHGLSARQAAALLWTGSVRQEGIVFLLCAAEVPVERGLFLPDREGAGRFEATLRRQLGTPYGWGEFAAHVQALNDFGLDDLVRLAHPYPEARWAALGPVLRIPPLLH